MLRMELPIIREACLGVLVLCTTFLKEAAAFGLCPSEIGKMMSREFWGHEEEPSEFELICIEARRLLEERNTLCDDVKAGDGEEFQFEIDCEELGFDLTLYSASRIVNGCNSLFSLEDSLEETESEKNVMPLRLDENFSPTRCWAPSFSNLSMSMKNISIGEKSWRHDGKMQKSGYLAGMSSGIRSVNEQLPGSASFVMLADMNEEDWVQYLDNFEKLLHPALYNHKLGKAGQRQKQRLGTSYRF